jgi:cytochrome b subunit of formate dehydrogenase
VTARLFFGFFGGYFPIFFRVRLSRLILNYSSKMIKDHSKLARLLRRGQDLRQNERCAQLTTYDKINIEKLVTTYDYVTMGSNIVK